MGICSSCFGNDGQVTPPDITPDQDTRRLQQLEAVEKRLQNQKNVGIKNPQRVARMQKKADERDKLQDQATARYDGDTGGLRWQMN